MPQSEYEAVRKAHIVAANRRHQLDGDVVAGPSALPSGSAAALHFQLDPDDDLYEDLFCPPAAPGSRCGPASSCSSSFLSWRSSPAGSSYSAAAYEAGTWAASAVFLIGMRSCVYCSSADPCVLQSAQGTSPAVNAQDSDSESEGNSDTPSVEGWMPLRSYGLASHDVLLYGRLPLRHLLAVHFRMTDHIYVCLGIPGAVAIASSCKEWSCACLPAMFSFERGGMKA